MDEKKLANSFLCGFVVNKQRKMYISVHSTTKRYSQRKEGLNGKNNPFQLKDSLFTI